ncbi:MAG: putative dsRNA-binding protein, partial [Chloroflexota bacterium]
EVLLDDRVVGRGVGHSKQAAEQAAAQTAWRALVGRDAVAAEPPLAPSSLTSSSETGEDELRSAVDQSSTATTS